MSARTARRAADLARVYAVELSVLAWAVVWLPVTTAEMPGEARRMLYVACLMASLWIHKPIPLAVTALLPLIALPLLAISPAKHVARSYMSDANMLFLGGFMVAAAVERCGLHRRLATAILLHTAGQPQLLLLGFMAATALLSAFMSNTATAAMQVPLAEGVIVRMLAGRRTNRPTSTLPRAETGSGLGSLPAVELMAKRDAEPVIGSTRDTPAAWNAPVIEPVPLKAEASCSGLPTCKANTANSAGACDGMRRTHSEPGTPPLLGAEEPSLSLLASVGVHHCPSDELDTATPFSSARSAAEEAKDAAKDANKLPPHSPGPGADDDNWRDPEHNPGRDEERADDDPEVLAFAKSLLLGISYSASLGGISTLTGTGPNLVLVGQLAAIYPDAPQLSFAVWTVFALPLVCVLLLFTWAIFSVVEALQRRQGTPRSGARQPLEVDVAALQAEYDLLGPFSRAEKSVVGLLLVTLTLWLTRHPVIVPGWGALFHPGYVSDATVIVTTTVLLFVLPGNAPPPVPLGSSASPQVAPRLLDWETTRTIPWDVVLLLGGGFALADGFSESGLSTFLACELLNNDAVGSLSAWQLLLILCCSVTALTELCSNVATCTIVLPILATVAHALKVDPRLLMIPATLSCSLAFMLPVSTPTNAIAFGTGRLEIRDMLGPGLALNAAGVACIVGGMLTYGIRLFDVEVGREPGWAAALAASDANPNGGCLSRDP